MQKHSDVNVYLFARYLQLLLLLLLTFTLIRYTPVVHSNMERPMQVRGLRVCYFRLNSALQSSSTYLIMTCPVSLNNFLPYFLLVLHLCLFLGFVFNFDLIPAFISSRGGGIFKTFCRHYGHLIPDIELFSCYIDFFSTSTVLWNGYFFDEGFCLYAVNSFGM